MSTDLLHFPRPELAHELALSVAGQRLFDSGASGLFLSAPRRTGKSTFLRQDLGPALKSAGATLVYVDLWARRDLDPGTLIANAVARATKEAQTYGARIREQIAAAEVDINGWLKMSAEKVGESDGPTFAEALEALAGMTRGPVALIVDEAQQALVSEAGERAMFALKAARDAMNSPDDVVLRLVMTGSDRDKLLRLVTSAAAPFYGAEVRTMPTLDEDYVRFVARKIEAERPTTSPIDIAMLTQAFEAFGWQPETFGSAVGTALNPLHAGERERFESRLLALAEAHRDAEHARMDGDFAALPVIARAVLWHLLERRERFRPFDREAGRFYERAMRELAVERAVDAQKVQRAIERLRQTSPPLLWRSARGSYALEDTAMQRWYDARVRAGEWPPFPPPEE